MRYPLSTRIAQAVLMFVALLSGLFGLLQLALLVFSLWHYGQSENVGIDWGANQEVLSVAFTGVVVIAIGSVLLARRLFRWSKPAEPPPP